MRDSRRCRDVLPEFDGVDISVSTCLGCNGVARPCGVALSSHLVVDPRQLLLHAIPNLCCILNYANNVCSNGGREAKLAKQALDSGVEAAKQ
jgi:hypothetical protein